MKMIALIPTIISSIGSLVKLYREIRTAAQQSSEMTSEELAAYDAQVESMFNESCWKVPERPENKD